MMQDMTSRDRMLRNVLTAGARNELAKSESAKKGEASPRSALRKGWSRASGDTWIAARRFHKPLMSEKPARRRSRYARPA